MKQFPAKNRRTPHLVLTVTLVFFALIIILYSAFNVVRYALGRFAGAIKAENDYRMAFVVNCHRPLTSTVDDAIEIMREIEAACGLKFTCIVNNSNLGPETVAATVRESLGFVEELSLRSGLEVWMHTAEESVARELTELEVLPMVLQRKIFDLPD